MVQIHKFIFVLLIAIMIAGQAAVPVMAQSNTPTASENFLSLADIHFDPFIACYSAGKKSCPLIQKLRESPASDWPRILQADDAGKPRYQEDTSYPLLVSALASARQTAAVQHVKFVIILGDFLAHDYRHYYKMYSGDTSLAGYQAFVSKTFAFLAAQIEQTFPGKDVYTVVGNNDTYFSDYSSEPDGAFFSMMAEKFSPLIRNKNNQQTMRHDFKTAGYYAETLPGSAKIRLIALNSVLFSYKAKGKGVSMAAESELVWLKRELAQAKQNHQRVMILMHIPPGIDVYSSGGIRLFTLMELWQQRYTSSFHAMLDNYSDQIMGIFGGHLHSDWMQYVTVHKMPDIIETGTPSVSPIFGNDPGYKIYSYSLNPARLDQFVSYYYPINDKPEWSTMLHFNRPNLLICDDCPGESDSSIRFSDLSHLNAHTDKPRKQWHPYYWCSTSDAKISAADKCLSN